MSIFKNIVHPEEATKHASEAHVTMKHFEDAIKKIKSQKENKPGEKLTVPIIDKYFFFLFY